PVDQRPVTDQGYRSLGGLVGHFNYEFVERLEAISPRAPHAFPEFEFGLYLDGLVFDHLTRKVVYFSHGSDRSHEFEAVAQKAIPEPTLRMGSPRANLDDAKFEKMVERAKVDITEGEIFQVVLSRPLDRDAPAD